MVVKVVVVEVVGVGVVSGYYQSRWACFRSSSSCQLASQPTNSIGTLGLHRTRVGGFYPSIYPAISLLSISFNVTQPPPPILFNVCSNVYTCASLCDLCVCVCRQTGGSGKLLARLDWATNQKLHTTLAPTTFAEHFGSGPPPLTSMWPHRIFNVEFGTRTAVQQSQLQIPLDIEHLNHDAMRIVGCWLASQLVRPLNFSITLPCPLFNPLNKISKQPPSSPMCVTPKSYLVAKQTRLFNIIDFRIISIQFIQGITVSSKHGLGSLIVMVIMMIIIICQLVGCSRVKWLCGQNSC